MNNKIDEINKQALHILQDKLKSYSNTREKRERLHRARMTVNMFMYGNEFGIQNNTIKIRIPQEPELT